ncbi:MAG: GNAT family protein [Anaerolineales bacterium]|jgi:RimJ/RimL family protein N-acetyltransferase|nr:GNAT family protein [Anaerolineales bacterium]
MTDFTISSITLEGQLVRLEPLSLSHSAGLAEAGSDPAIWRYMPYGDVSLPGAMDAWVRDILQRQAAGTDLPFAVIHKPSARLAGATRYLEIRPAHRGLEIGGTWYAPEFQRTGVNTESKYLLLRHAFEVLGCIRVQFKADANNERSLRGIERIGAQREGILRNHMILSDGRRRDSAYYSILESEWPAVKTSLEALLIRT